MATAKESNTWEWLRQARGLFGPALSMRRTENLVSKGDADVDGVLRGAPFYIELKAANRPARPSTKLKHEPVKFEQIAFADEVRAAGAAHAFLVQVGSGHERRFFLVQNGRWLAMGRTEEELEFHGVEVHTPVEAIERTLKMKGVLP